MGVFKKQMSTNNYAFENILMNNKISITPGQAILEITSEWEMYKACRDRASAMGKGSLTLRKMFEHETGILLPFLCIWKTQAEMVAQYQKGG